MRKIALAAFVLFLALPSFSPGGEKTYTLTVLKKYRLKHVPKRSGSEGSFGLTPEAGGFYLRTYRERERQYRSERYDDCEARYYLQINDELFGPYCRIDAEQYRRGGRYSFTYRDTVFPDRACYVTTRTCCGPFGLVCYYSPLGPLAESLGSREGGYIRKHGMGEYVVVNGRRYGPYDDVLSVSFAHTGDSFGFKYKEKHKDYFIHNGRRIGPYGSSYGQEIVVSPNGRRYAYFYHSPRGPVDRGYLVLDGVQYGPFSWAKNFSFSPDSRSFAFLHSKGGGDILWRDGKETPVRSRKIYVPKYPIMTQGIFGEMFTPGVVEKRPGGYYVSRGKREYGPFEKVGRLAANSDGSLFGFDYVRNDRYYVQINEKSYGPYEKTGTPFFTRTGGGFYFWYKKGDREYYRINGKDYGPFREARVYLSDDGRSHAFVYWGGKGTVVQLNGRVLGPFGGTHYWVRFSADGRRYGFVHYMRIGDKRIRNWDDPFRERYLHYCGQTFGPYRELDLRFISGDRAIVGYVRDGYAFVAELK